MLVDTQILRSTWPSRVSLTLLPPGAGWQALLLYVVGSSPLPPQGLGSSSTQVIVPPPIRAREHFPFIRSMHVCVLVLGSPTGWKPYQC